MWKRLPIEYTSQAPLYGRYIPNNDAGHYESAIVNTPDPLLPLRVNQISPIPARATSSVTKRKQRAGKSQVLTSLEDNKWKRPSSKASNPRKKAKAGCKEKKTETWFCFYCQQDIQEDMICCQVCKEWAHSACAGTKGPAFICERCSID